MERRVFEVQLRKEKIDFLNDVYELIQKTLNESRK